MRKLKDIIIKMDSKIIDAINTLEKSHLQIAVVLSENGSLKGVVTDGDVRRGILKGISLESPVKDIMNNSPYTMHISSERTEILSIMRKKHFRHMLLVDEEHKLVGIETLEDILELSVYDNWVVIMAGGIGSRLKPLTNDMPKPLLNVGGRPILESCVRNLVEQGFNKFYISLNYKAKMVSDYFGDGEKFGAEIRYIHEEKPLGTAGALSLLPEKIDEEIFVMNGDILTNIEFSNILKFHRENDSTATMCVREYDHQVPYGVVEVDDHKFVEIQEKPTHSFFVNAGIYLINPEVFSLIPKHVKYDMPDLFKAVQKTSTRVSVFPIREYWIDIGQIDDYARANDEFNDVYSYD
jgi:dTDP-glucose pyrophosphorylase